MTCFAEMPFSSAASSQHRVRFWLLKLRNSQAAPLLILVFCLKLSLGAQTPSQPGGAEPSRDLPTLTAEQYSELRNDQDNQLLIVALNAIRQAPQMLDDAFLLKWFAKLNNCQHWDNITRLNEFNYPPVAAFYKSHAAQILAGAPTTIELAFFENLKEYDRDLFPFAKPLVFRTVQLREPHGNRGRVCGTGNPALTVPTQWMVRLEQPVEIDGLHMDEAAAREFLKNINPAARTVALVGEIELLPAPPQISRSPRNSLPSVQVAGKLRKLTVVDKFPGGTTLMTLDPDSPSTSRSSQSNK